METSKKYSIARRRMVEEQLRARGITDEKVIEAFLAVPRHLFVADGVISRAYDDCSLPIGCDQTISQPYTIAFMLQALELKKTSRVLEIGTGSGYQTALLAHIAREVFSVERIETLLRKAERKLSMTTNGCIRLKLGDGSQGWRSYAPFDRVIVSASMKRRPTELLNQLAEDGLLVAPIGKETSYITLFSKKNGFTEERSLKRCAFVPLLEGEI